MFKVLLQFEDRDRHEERNDVERQEEDAREEARERRTLARGSRTLERGSRRLWDAPAPPALPAEEPERTHWEPQAAQQLQEALAQQEQEEGLFLEEQHHHGDDEAIELHIDGDDFRQEEEDEGLHHQEYGDQSDAVGILPRSSVGTGVDILPAATAPTDSRDGGSGGGGGDAGGARKGGRGGKAAVSKKLLQHTWLRIDTFGRTSLISTDKQRLALKLGVQPRDLRMLDAALASVSPQTILDRERAIVVNLGPIKCIITLEYVLVVNPGDEAAKPFIETLQEKLSNPMHVGKVISYPGLSQLSGVRSRMLPPSAANSAAGSAAGSHTAGPAIGLSFELKVLEICLDITVGAMDSEARELKDVIEPTLDDLTRRVKQQELELLRKCKNRLTRLVKRVETIKEVLEKFLEDDEDMHRLNLTAQQMIMARQATMALDGPTPRGLGRLSKRPSRRASLASTPGGSSSSSSSSSSSGSGRSMDLEEEAQVAEVEMLLEAYQMHLDHLYNKLQSLEQFVEDGEDLVNVSLDEHRNRIIAVDVVLTGFVTAMGLGTAITGLFGVNIPYHDLISRDYINFEIIATVGAVVGPVLIMGTFVGWAIYSGAVTLG